MLPSSVLEYLGDNHTTTKTTPVTAAILQRRFNETLELPSTTADEQLRRLNLLNEVIEEFNTFVIPVAKDIVENRHNSDWYTAHHSALAETDVFVINDVEYTIVNWEGSDHVIDQGHEICRKMAGLEVRTLRAILEMHLQVVAIPLTAAVTYLGMRVLCRYSLPSSSRSLKLGSVRPFTRIIYPGRTQKYDVVSLPGAFTVIQNSIGDILNLRSYTQRGITLKTPSDVQGHELDGRYYLFNVCRLLPPTCDARENKDRERMAERMRPEFVVMNQEAQPLLSTALSQHPDEHVEGADNESHVSTVRIFNECIPALGRTLISIAESEESKGKQQQLKHSDASKLCGATLIDLMHKHGINVRYLPLVLKYVRDHGASETGILVQCIKVEMTARCIRKILYKKWRVLVTAGNAQNGHQEAMRVLNMLTSEGITCHDNSDRDFWLNELIPSVKATFGLQLKFLRCGMGKTAETEFPLKLHRIHPTCSDVSEAPHVYPQPIFSLKTEATAWGSLVKAKDPYEPTPPIVVQKIKQTHTSITPEVEAHRIFLHKLLTRTAELSGLRDMHYSSFTGLHFSMQPLLHGLKMTKPLHLVLQSQRRYADAENLYLAEIRWRRKQWQGSSMGDMKAIPVHRNLASLYTVWGRKDLAMEIIKKSIETCRREFSSNPTACIQAEFHLARLLYMNKEYRLAEKTLGSSIHGAEDVFRNSMFLYRLRVFQADICLRPSSSIPTTKANQQEEDSTLTSLIGNCAEITKVLSSTISSLQSYSQPAHFVQARILYAEIINNTETYDSQRERFAKCVKDISNSFYDIMHIESIRSVLILISITMDGAAFASLVPLIKQIMPLDGAEFFEIVTLRHKHDDRWRTASCITWMEALLNDSHTNDTLSWRPRKIASVNVLLETLSASYQLHHADPNEGRKLLIRIDSIFEKLLGPNSILRIGTLRQLGMWYLGRMVDSASLQTITACVSQMAKVETATKYFFQQAEIEGLFFNAAPKEFLAFDVATVYNEFFTEKQGTITILISPTSMVGLKVQPGHISSGTMQNNAKENTTTTTASPSLLAPPGASLGSVVIENSTASPHNKPLFCVPLTLTLQDINATFAFIKEQCLRSLNKVAQMIEDIDILQVEKHWKLCSTMWYDLFMLQARRHNLDLPDLPLSLLRDGIDTLQTFVRLTREKLGSFNNVVHYEKLLVSYTTKEAYLSEQQAEITKVIMSTENKTDKAARRRSRDMDGGLQTSSLAVQRRVSGNPQSRILEFHDDILHFEPRSHSITLHNEHRSLTVHTYPVSFFVVHPQGEMAPGTPLHISWQLSGSPMLDNAWIGFYKLPLTPESTPVIRYSRFDVRQRKGTVHHQLVAPTAPGDYLVGYMTSYTEQPKSPLTATIVVLGIPPYKPPKLNRNGSRSPERIPSPRRCVKLPAVTVPFDTKISESRRQEMVAKQHCVKKNMQGEVTVKFGTKKFQRALRVGAVPISFVITEDGRRVIDEGGNDD